jgi:alanyl-tRNA synthetase
MIGRETEKYGSTIDKGRRRVATLAQRYRGQRIPTDEVIKMYDSHGIPPEIVEAVATESGAHVELPDDFYSLVAAEHERVKVSEEPTSEAVLDLPATDRLFYDEPEQGTFKAKVVGLSKEGIILDRTLFYPGGGGQPEDTGYITSHSGKEARVRLARVLGNAIIHEVDDVRSFAVGERVTGKIDIERRQSLARHHTATHILLASIRAVLGDHIWQEGAQKGVHVSRLDVSHYKKVTVDEQNEIELRANAAIMVDTEVQQRWMDRNEAEQKYGFALYQGGVPQGGSIRIVEVGTDDPDVTDVQACAGTHMTRTGKVGSFRIRKTEGIQDGVERFEFYAGVPAVKYNQQLDAIIRKPCQTLRVTPEQLASEVDRYFEEWKQRGKDYEKLRPKFLSLAGQRASVNAAQKALRVGDLEKVDNELTSMDAAFERLTSVTVEMATAKAVAKAYPPTVWIQEEMKRGNGPPLKILSSSTIIDADMKELLHTSQELLNDKAVVILGGVRAGQAHVVITVRANVAKEGLDAATIVKKACSILGGSGGGRPERAQGGGPYADKINEAVSEARKLVREKLESLGYRVG